MGEDEVEDCKTWAEFLKKHYFVKEIIRTRIIGILTVKKRKYGLQYKRRTALRGANTYIYTYMCVYVFCIQCNPIFTLAKPTFYKNATSRNKTVK